MTTPGPIVVVTVPARSPEAARSEVDAAARSGAQAVEVRLDRWPAGRLSEMGQLFPSPVPLMATYRSTAEGGEGADGEGRRSLLSTCFSLPYHWVDVEAARDEPERWAALGHAPRMVVSTHLLGPDSVQRFPIAWAVGGPDGCLRKVVVRADVGEAMGPLLRAVRGPTSARRILHTVGPSGPLFRAIARGLGLPLVFAAPSADAGRPGIEPAQIPVDRIAPYLAADAAPLFALLGHPVEHTLSPSIHHAWMARERKVGLYISLDISTAEELSAALQGLPEYGLRGANVTAPWKAEALRLASAASGDARASGAANTLTFNGRIVTADNTDVGAIRRRLNELREQGSWSGESILVVGTGGAARATLCSARDLGGEVWLGGRDSHSVASLAREFEARPAPRLPVRPPSLVVHATTVGRAESRELEFPLAEWLSPGTRLLDWVYTPDVPTLAELAARRGATYEDGRRLLVYQAAGSYRAWWGDFPATDAVEAVLTEVGCAG